MNRSTSHDREGKPVMTVQIWQSEDGTRYENCVTFCRIRERFGPLSNIAKNYPLEVNGVQIGSSEALYQACRFPHEPEWQHEIIAAKSALAAKKESRLRFSHESIT